MDFANRVKNLEASATLTIAAKAKELIKSGEDVISLSAGEPDWDPPFEAKEASIQAVRDNNAHYTENSGMLDLKKAIKEKLKTENNIEAETKNIIITAGAKFGLYLAMQTLVNEGDEVAVISPYWVSYVEQIKLAGGVPKIIQSSEDEGFKVEVEELEKQITSRVRGIILNYPSNPAGVTYSSGELRAIADLAEKKNIFLLSDEIYEYFSYEDRHVSIESLAHNRLSNIITINGFSKSYSIPGWRVGYAVGGEQIIKKMDEIQSHSTSNPNNIAQFACIAAIKGSGEYLKKMVSEFNERRNYLVNALNSIHGVRCHKPDGSFYVFPNIKYYLAKEVGGKVPTNSVEFCRILLEKALISAVPGSAFGLEGFVRLSYTQPLKRLEEAVKRLKKVLDN